ncbi:MAG: hypothetical protein AAFQ91_09105 [Cyanobacteria bacterium J06621_15]
MSYSQFTIDKVKQDFGLQIVEGVCFFPNSLEIITPTQRLQGVLEDLPWAIAVDTEKARSEVIINPVLLEVRRILNQEISVFSGEEFNVDTSIGLNGVYDFLISRSPEQLTVEAPKIMIVEAKQPDLKSGIGKCISEMVAAQRFNEIRGKSINTIYGCVSSGTQWRFLKLEAQTVTIDLMDYSLPPVEQIVSFLVWMVKEG